MSQSKIGAFVVSTDSFFGFIGGERLVMQAERHRIPGVYNARSELRGRGLISYGPKLSDTWRQAGIYAGRILQGEKPANLPVMQPTRLRWSSISKRRMRSASNCHRYFSRAPMKSSNDRFWHLWDMSQLSADVRPWR